MEEALCNRLSFVRFMGLSLDHDEAPDSTTICRFRQSLVKRNILKCLLDKLNHSGLSFQERDELRRLRRESKPLRDEREILSKAAALFAKEADSTPRKRSGS